MTKEVQNIEPEKPNGSISLKMQKDVPLTYHSEKNCSTDRQQQEKLVPAPPGETGKKNVKRRVT